MSVQAARDENARLKARRLLAKFGVESADHVHVEGFAERLQVRLREAPLDGARAQLVVRDHGKRAQIILSTRMTDPAERRFAIAHELGHFVLKHPAPDLSELEPAELSCHPLEHEANCFAMELLMPMAVVSSLHNANPMTLDAPAKLAQLCRVSIVVAAIRTAECTERVCAAVLSKRGAVDWVAPSQGFAHAFRGPLATALIRGKRLDVRARAHGIQRSRAAFPPVSVLSRAWLGDHVEPFPLLEHSIAVGTSDEVLTMLWAPYQEAAISAAAHKPNAAHPPGAADDDITTKLMSVSRRARPDAPR
jgi:hypothetical protein